MNENLEGLPTSIASALSELKLSFISFIPNLLSALIILICGILVAFLLKWLSLAIVRWASHILPANVTEKQFVQKNLTPLAKGTGRLLFFIVLFFTITTSLKRLGFQIVSDWLQNISQYLPNIVGAIFIIYLGWKLKEFLSELTYKTLSKSGFSHSRIAADTIGWSLFIISALVSLEQIGIDMTLVIITITVLIGVASAGIALTFALGAKSTISDILCCYQVHKFLSVGQYIEILGHSGIIKSIGPIFVLLETEEGKVTLPGTVFNREATLIKESGKN